MDEDFLKCFTNLKFIGRPGAGLENIDWIIAPKTTSKFLDHLKGTKMPSANISSGCF